MHFGLLEKIDHAKNNENKPTQYVKKLFIFTSEQGIDLLDKKNWKKNIDDIAEHDTEVYCQCASNALCDAIFEQNKEDRAWNQGEQKPNSKSVEDDIHITKIAFNALEMLEVN